MIYMAASGYNGVLQDLGFVERGVRGVRSRLHSGERGVRWHGKTISVSSFV
jgi:hypothetical protein